MVHQPSGRHTAEPATSPTATARKPPYPAPRAKTPDMSPSSITQTPTKLVEAASAASASLWFSENSYSLGGGCDEPRAGADGASDDARGDARGVGLVDLRGGSLIRSRSLYRRASWRLAARRLRSRYRPRTPRAMTEPIDRARAPAPVPDEGVAEGPLHERLLEAIRREFPRFEVLPKRGSALQRAIGRVLAVVTLGGQRHYMTRYHTVLFGKLYVPDVWDTMDDRARYVLLRHERVHLRQRRQMGDVVMAFVYLLPIFPLGLAWGRARIEWEAYVETIVATAEVYGLEAARGLEGEIVRRYTGPDYGWMWPFPATVRRWFREVIAGLTRP